MINRLLESTTPVEVQDTTLSLDVLGRYLCSTWDEATNNLGAPFTAVVIGSGMFGAYCAEKIYRAGQAKNVRVLVLEAGPFLVSEHVQNLARIGLNVPGPIAADPGVARERVWGLPWRSNQAFPGLAYCLGGRSLYWGGWSPRLTAPDLANWPAATATLLGTSYPTVEREIGVDPSADFITGALYQALLARTQAVAGGVANVTAVEEAPLAVQGAPPASGLFSFDKFSSAPILADAIREAAASSDASRRLFLVPRTHVLRMRATNGVLTGLDAVTNGRPVSLNLAANCGVVLAAGTIESTRLALDSFPTQLMGRNLMAHLRTNFQVRIRRSALGGALPAALQTAALLVRGETPQGRFHFQITASASPGSASDALLFRMIPDIDLLDATLAAQSANFVAITCRGIGEMVGDRLTAVPNPGGSWINLSPFEADEFGRPRAWVNLLASAADLALWDTMDATSLALMQQIAGNAADIEYFYNGTWNSLAPTPAIMRQLRDGLGTTHHEAGTLWMGIGPNNSVTDLNGRLHHISNAYVAGPAVFPSLGSANPSLTALALARQTAATVVANA
jgi:choline dehydrogenase-like flavoprotein